MKILWSGIFATISLILVFVFITTIGNLVNKEENVNQGYVLDIVDTEELISIDDSNETFTMGTKIIDSEVYYYYKTKGESKMKVVSASSSVIHYLGEEEYVPRVENKKKVYSSIIKKMFVKNKEIYHFYIPKESVIKDLESK